MAAALRGIVTTAALGGALCAQLGANGLRRSTASAGTVRGQLTIVSERGEATTDGLWRIENGILPVTPRGADPRSECLVLLEPKGPTKSKDPAKPEAITAELRSMRLQPAILLVPFGASIEIKNDDIVPHTLLAQGADADVFPPRLTPAGATRSERPKRPGIFALRDEDSPHVRGWLVVIDTAIAVRPDEHWAWKLEAPDGTYTLRVLFRNGVALERTVKLTGKPLEINLPLPASAR